MACQPAGLTARREGERAALNGRLVIAFDGALDPLTVTAGSVSVRDPSGHELAAERRVEGHRLVVLLVVGPALLAHPPEEVIVRLTGLPSPAALADTSGRRLERGLELRFAPQPGLEARGRSAPTLVAVDGRSVRTGDTFSFGAEVRLELDGVVDPATVVPESCPLVPVAEGLALTPVLPEVRWAVVGERTRIWLRPAPGPERLELHTRRLGLAGLYGQPVENLLKLVLVRD